MHSHAIFVSAESFLRSSLGDNGESVFDSQRGTQRLEHTSLRAEIANHSTVEPFRGEQLDDLVLIDAASYDVIFRVVRRAILEVDSSGPAQPSGNAPEEIPLEHAP
jgi:hypothetical protein